MKFLAILIFWVSFSSISLSENYNLKRIVTLNEPWGSSFISNTELIITERNGVIKIVNIYSKEVKEIKHNLNYLASGQGGLLDIIYQKNSIWMCPNAIPWIRHSSGIALFTGHFPAIHSRPRQESNLRPKD